MPEESKTCHCEEQTNPHVTLNLFQGLISVHRKKEILWKTIHFSRNQKISEKVVKQVQNDVFVLCKKRAAFTLAETLIVLVILGIVASITVPALVRNQMEAQNRTRLRKAMTVYDMAINKMVVENNFKSNTALTDWANGNNCVNTREYFKIVQDGKNGCIFSTSGGLWWNITDITKPIIGFNENDIETANSTTSFQLFGHFGENGELRIDDMAYELANKYLTNEEKENLNSLYNFVNNVKEEPFYYNWYEEYANISKYLKVECNENKKTQCYEKVEYRNCDITINPEENCGVTNVIDIFIHDSQGNNIGYYETDSYSTEIFNNFNVNNLSAEDINITEMPVYNSKGEKIPITPDGKSCNSMTSQFNCKTYKNWDNCECDLDDADDPESEICYCYDN